MRTLLETAEGFVTLLHNLRITRFPLYTHLCVFVYMYVSATYTYTYKYIQGSIIFIMLVSFIKSSDLDTSKAWRFAFAFNTIGWHHLSFLNLLLSPLVCDNLHMVATLPHTSAERIQFHTAFGHFTHIHFALAYVIYVIPFEMGSQHLRNVSPLANEK